MNKFRILFALILSIVGLAFTNSDLDDKDLCKVSKYNGKYIFWQCVPVSDYEEVFTVKLFLENCLRQTSQSEEMIKEAIVQASMSKIEFDAVVVGSTERDVAIRFLNPADDKSIGRVKRFNNIPVFIDCLPISNYSQIKRVKKFRKVDNKCFNSTRIAEILTKKKVKNDALIIGDDQFHWWIKFQ